MHPILTPFLFVAVLMFSVTVSNASAKEKYNFVGTVINIARPDMVLHPVYAILELSGESPYDHTNIESLIFTQKAGNIFGYTGEYTGIFDSSSLSIIATADGRLTSSDYDGSSSFLAAGVTDGNPPPFTEGEATLSNSSKLSMYFGTPDIDYFSITGTQSLERNIISGVWVMVVPEPTSLAFIICGLLLGLGRRVRRIGQNVAAAHRYGWL